MPRVHKWLSQKEKGMKILLFGKGNAGARHYDIFSGLGCEVIVIDPLQEDADYPTMESLDQPLEAFDAFIVATPPSAREMVPALMELGKPLLCEKPLTCPGCEPTMDWWASHKNRDNVRVNLQMPYMSTYQSFKNEVEQLPINAGEYLLVMVIAHTNWHKWVGMRGPHRHPIPVKWEMIHDIDLALRLSANDGLAGLLEPVLDEAFSFTGLVHTHRMRIILDLHMESTTDEVRHMMVMEPASMRPLSEFRLDRHENDEAYKLLAIDFLSTMEQAPSQWATTVTHWQDLMNIMNQKVGASA